MFEDFTCLLSSYTAVNMDDHLKEYFDQTPAIVSFSLKNLQQGNDTEGFRLEAPEIDKEFIRDGQVSRAKRSKSGVNFNVKGALGWFTVARLGPNLDSNLGPNFDQVGMPSRRHCRE